MTTKLTYTKQPRRLAFKPIKVSVNRKQIPVVYGFHTTFVDEGQEVTLVAPSMVQLEKAYDRFTGTTGEFEIDSASEIVMMDRLRFTKTRWNRARSARNNPTTDSSR